MSNPELKADTGIVVASLSEEAVKVEVFPISKNILTPDEAKEIGLKFIKPKSSKKIAVWCGGISIRFKDYHIVTNSREIESCIEKTKKLDTQAQKGIWLSITRNLHRYTDEELNHHYEETDKQWFDWCNDAVIWYAYNVVLFKKGIPASEVTAEMEESIH